MWCVVLGFVVWRFVVLCYGWDVIRMGVYYDGVFDDGDGWWVRVMGECGV